MCDARRNETKVPITLDAVEIDSLKLKLGNEVGDGSQSIVRKGRWNELIVAIKEFTPTNTRRACEKEINMMSFLNKRIPSASVSLYGYVKPIPPENYKVVMQYCSSGSLADQIEAYEDAPDWSIRYKWMQSIVGIVADLHSCNVIHRDIKPDNFFLDNQQRVKVGDLGFAKHIEKSKSHVGKVLKGTPPYIPPEVWLGNVYSEKSDIFSLATILWEISTWSFASADIPEESYSYDIMQKILKGERETIPQDLPPRIAKLITWGWAQNPNQRPTAAEYQAEFNLDMNAPLSDKLNQLVL